LVHSDDRCSRVRQRDINPQESQASRSGLGPERAESGRGTLGLGASQPQLPLLRQRIVDRHADLSNVVSSHFAVWLKQISLEHLSRPREQCNQFIVRHAFP
jgi:hypothetical protein